MMQLATIKQVNKRVNAQMDNVKNFHLVKVEPGKRFHFTFSIDSKQDAVEIVEWDPNWLHEIKRTRTISVADARKLWASLEAEGYTRNWETIND